MSETAYRTPVVGTAGSASSLRAVPRACAYLPGSVPAGATRRSRCDALVVHTTG